MSDEEWAIIEPLIPPSRRGGRPRKVDVREVLNGIFYILSTGCQWQALPKDPPPRSTAHAQAMFDCWMQEQEEDFQPADIIRCRSGFRKSMARIADALKPMPMAAKPAPMPVKKMMAPAPFTGPYVVQFKFDSAELTPHGKCTLARAAADAAKVKPNQVKLAGHTDRAGSAKYNLVLSKSRVDAVAQALIGLGVSPSMIGKSIHGEEMPALATADVVRKHINRRVVVTFER